MEHQQLLSWLCNNSENNKYMGIPNDVLADRMNRVAQYSLEYSTVLYKFRDVRGRKLQEKRAEYDVHYKVLVLYSYSIRVVKNGSNCMFAALAPNNKQRTTTLLLHHLQF